MKFYRVYIENDGRNRRGANSDIPAKYRESDKVWFSPESPFVVTEYEDGQGRCERVVCYLDKVGDPTFRIRFFEGEAECIGSEELFACLGKKKEVKKEVAKKVRKPRKKKEIE